MTRVSVREYERLYRGRRGEQSGDRRGERRVISKRHFQRLRRFDERQAGDEGELIFEWRRAKLWPKQWVGVVQVGDLTVEILPKIDPREPDRGASDGDVALARRNLTYMLAMAGELPLRPRDVASLATEEASLLDVFIDIFARRLSDELKRGRHRNYVRRQNNRNVLKGKLKFAEHIRHNAARKDRFFVEYDEYLEDNRLNRIFRAACRTLQTVASRPATEEQLRRCLLLLDDVEDVPVRPPDFERVQFTRNNRRFRSSFEFCRLLYLGRSPTAAAGGVRTYSVLFDMNSLYERFIAEVVRRHVLRGDRTTKYELDVQSEGTERHLLWTGASGSGGAVRMKPDIVVTERAAGLEEDARVELVMDTKWKRLERGTSGGITGLSTADLYQLYAYTRRYRARRGILLYPHPGGELTGEDYLVPESVEEEVEQRLGVNFVDFDRDFARSSAAREALVDELSDMI